MQDQESKYREMIDELTNELTSLSDQVQATQNELNPDELTKFEATFHELEMQNEKLQKIIEELERKIDGYESLIKNNQAEVRQDI